MLGSEVEKLHEGLSKFVGKKPKGTKFFKRKRLQLFQQQDGKCFYCGCEMVIETDGDLKYNSLTLEHLFEKGHPNRSIQYQDIKKYAAACHKCNHERGIWTDSVSRQNKGENIFAQSKKEYNYNRDGNYNYLH